jgi:hypothetical protein
MATQTKNGPFWTNVVFPRNPSILNFYVINITCEDCKQHVYPEMMFRCLTTMKMPYWSSYRAISNIRQPPFSETMGKN